MRFARSSHPYNADDNHEVRAALQGDFHGRFLRGARGSRARRRRTRSSSSACRARVRRCSSKSWRATRWSRAPWSCRISRGSPWRSSGATDAVEVGVCAGRRRACRRTSCAPSANGISPRRAAQRKTDTPFFIDKMPNNWLYVWLIHLILPNAKIIDARRHPLGCCFSGIQAAFRPRPEFFLWLGDIGRYYRDYVELMAHVDAVLPGRVHRVFYESMIDDTEVEVRRLLEYCGLPFEEHACGSTRTIGAVRTASSEQVRQPIFRDGVDHWRHYEPWLGPLKDALGPVLDAIRQVPDFHRQLILNALLVINSIIGSKGIMTRSRSTNQRASGLERRPQPRDRFHALRAACFGHLGDPCRRHARGACRIRDRVPALSKRSWSPRRRRSKTCRTCRSASRCSTTRRSRQLHITNLDDYVKYSPSVSYVRGQGQGGNGQPGTSHIYMRGVVSGGDENHSGSQPSVGTYLDEAAGDDHRRHAGRPYLRHRAHRGPRRTAGHPVRRKFRGGHDSHHHQQAGSDQIRGELRPRRQPGGARRHRL